MDFISSLNERTKNKINLSSENPTLCKTTANMQILIRPHEVKTQPVNQKHANNIITNKFHLVLQLRAIYQNGLTIDKYIGTPTLSKIRWEISLRLRFFQDKQQKRLCGSSLSTLSAIYLLYMDCRWTTGSL